jgi:nitrile hydratase subunit beta
VNGVHDMGGMQDMGAITHEPHEPPFHMPWEGRVYALSRALRTGRTGPWNLDAFRHGIEKLPPADYLRMTYYERWFAWILATLVATGDATQTEIDTGLPAPGAPRATPLLTPEAVPATVALRGTARRDVAVAARFKAGQKIRARNMHPTGHTRLPRYVRGKTGVVAIDRGVFLFPDTNAHLLGEKPQHLYSVRFAARELWGDRASSRDVVHLDMWDDYLEHA